ncbi:MAG TPA: hypothetical protein VE263_15550 [Candidatus Angelobacter sp.]|nr:hypothetical protein [Candidatus Angelobacter sp.]
MSAVALRSHRFASQRRSQRVLLAIRVLLEGRRSNGQPFKEEAQTVVVNAHGALILLVKNVDVAQPLTIRNLKSGEQVRCKVTNVGAVHDGKREIGIEFAEPSVRFWRVAFPPEDWSPHSPEAKRRANGPITFSKMEPSSSLKNQTKK